MPITPFLDGLKFDPEAKRVMGVAFEMARIALRLADRGDIASDAPSLITSDDHAPPKRRMHSFSITNECTRDTRHTRCSTCEKHRMMPWNTQLLSWVFHVCRRDGLAVSRNISRLVGHGAGG